MTKKESKAAIEARKAYRRAWAAKNRDKQKEYTRRYWEKKAAQAAAAAEAESAGAAGT